MRRDGLAGLWLGTVAACAFLTLAYNQLIGNLDFQSVYREIRQRRDDENAVALTIKQTEGDNCNTAEEKDCFQRVQDNQTKFRKVIAFDLRSRNI